MQYIAYLRVSSQQQAASGLGLEAQEQACQNFAIRAGGDLSNIFRDKGVSGSIGLEGRPYLLEAINGLRRGDILVVAKRDRLGRDPLVVAMIEAAVTRRKARVVSAAGEGTDGDGPTDVLIRRIVDAFAEYERLIIGARTSAALRAKRTRGERVGAIPYGFKLGKDGRTLRPVVKEQAVIAKARELREKGMPLRAVSTELRRLGWLSRTGKPFHPVQIDRMVKAE